MPRKTFCQNSSANMTQDTQTIDSGQHTPPGGIAETRSTSARLLEMYRGLVEVSTLINSVSGFQALLPAILDVARRVLRAEAGSLFLADDDGNLTLAAAGGGPTGAAESGSIVVPRGHGISGWVYEHREPALVPDAYADPRFYRETDAKTGFHTRSILCVPLQVPGLVLGVLQLLNPENRAAFDEQDVEVLDAYSNLAATAIARTRAEEETKQTERLHREIELAAEIQQGLLPAALPQHANLSLEARYFPARNIGGDFYDVIPFDDESVYFVIGDVSGKGVPAAIGMARSLSILRFALRPGLSPGAVLQAWNRPLALRPAGRLFSTAIVGRIHFATGLCELAAAGHPAPLLIKASGCVEEVEIDGGYPISIDPDAAYKTTTFKLAPGDGLLLFTDGLTESFSPDRIMLPPAEIAASMRRALRHGESILDRLTELEQEHRGSSERQDDLTLLLATFTGPTA